MATIKIEFKTDNAAFDGNEPGEVCNVLRELIRSIEAHEGFEPMSGKSYPARDSNGNRVGWLTVQK